MEVYIRSLIEKLKSGISIESPNLDIKQSWWDLATNGGTEEFVKDICALANFSKGDSLIIIGITETGDLINAPLPYDESTIQAKHKDKVIPRINLTIEELRIDSSTISIIKVPHSSNRPHIIKKWKDRENYIPVRIGTSTYTASRADLDEMYAERSTAQPEIEIQFLDESLRWDNFADYRDASFMVTLTVNNTGSVPDYLTNVTLKENSGDFWKSKYFKFEGIAVGEAFEVPAFKLIKRVPVYLSDIYPQDLRNGNTRKAPDMDIDTLSLVITTRSDRVTELKIKPAWVRV